MSVKTNSDIKKMSFEDAMHELEGIISGLDSGNIKLDNAVESYTRGSLLKKHCEKKLSEAKLKIEKIVFDEDNNIATQEFENKP